MDILDFNVIFLINEQCNKFIIFFLFIIIEELPSNF